MTVRNTGATVLSVLILMIVSGCSEPRQTARLPENTPSGRTPSIEVSQPNPAATSDLSSLTAAPEKTAATWPPCSFVIAADVDGNGNDELLCWYNGGLSFWNSGDQGPYETVLSAVAFEERIAGIPNLATKADLDRDGRDDVIIGYGMGRGKKEVPVQVVALRVKGESGNHRQVMNLLYQATSYRPQVVGLAIADLEGSSRPEIFLAHHDSKYYVAAFVLRLASGPDPLAGPFKARRLARIRMASSWAAGRLPGRKKASLFVGRPYGEKKLEPGDLFLLRGTRRVHIPTRLGVRSVAFGDADGDGVPDLLFGDGWHHEYGRKAEGRLSIARLEPGGWTTRLIQRAPDQYEIRRIRVLDVDQDGHPEIVAAGNRHIDLFWHAKSGWMVRRLADGTDFELARFGGVWHLVVPGTPIRVLSLDGARSGGVPVSPNQEPRAR